MLCTGNVEVMLEERIKNQRRTWPQRIFIFFNFFLAIALLVSSNRLDSFEDAVESIVRIEVPAGVLAELPGKPEVVESVIEDSFEEASGSERTRVFQPNLSGPARNILIIGTDSALGLDADDPAAKRDRSAAVGLADVIMLVRLDPALGKASIISLPRDLYVTIYHRGVPVRQEKLASAILVGGLELGAPTLVETVTNNFDVPIHNFVVVDFHGFEQVVEEIGGVPVWFPYPVRDIGSGLVIDEVGCSLLDGRDSLAFVRSRKMEAFVDGDWYRVGVWNDLERNQRQQGFLIQALNRTIAKGARSVIIRDDLIRATTKTVVLDDRLTLRVLLGLGRSFSDFQPSDLERHVLPVTDDAVKDSAVLRLAEGAQESLDVFRGITLRPEEVAVELIDGRSGIDESILVSQHLEHKGFAVEANSGDQMQRTTIRAAVEDYSAAVLLAQYIEPIPWFEFVDRPTGKVELFLGDDFKFVLLAPLPVEVVDTVARSALPVLSNSESAIFDSIGQQEKLSSVHNFNSPLPMRSGEISPMKLVREINGQPPSGFTCP